MQKNAKSSKIAAPRLEWASAAPKKGKVARNRGSQTRLGERGFGGFGGWRSWLLADLEVLVDLAVLAVGVLADVVVLADLAVLAGPAAQKNTKSRSYTGDGRSF